MKKAWKSILRERHDRLGVNTVRGCGRSFIPVTSLKGDKMDGTALTVGERGVRAVLFEDELTPHFCEEGERADGRI